LRDAAPATRDAAAVARGTEFLGEGPRAARVDSVEIEEVKPEGHEQFAIRGVSAGVFVVQEHQATSHHFDLRLEVDGVMKSWAVPKGPSMDPAVKRMAIQVDDHGLDHNDFESDSVIVWDRGSYEQGGRVPWPEALDRGHAVFVLHGSKLQGGFALQRTRGGAKPQWLLIKRRDENAAPESDIAAERPMPRRNRARRSDSVAVEPLPHENVAVDDGVQFASDLGRFENGSARPEHDQILIVTSVREYRHTARRFQGVERVHVHFVEHVEAATKQFGPCGPDARIRRHNDSIDRRPAELKLPSKTITAQSVGSIRLEYKNCMLLFGHFSPVNRVLKHCYTFVLNLMP